MGKYIFDIKNECETLQFAAEELQKRLQLLNAPDMKITLLADSEELDGFTVDMNFPAGHGFIKGSNPRSTLFGVYRLLKSLGFRWIRPGDKGETVPPPPEKWDYIRHWEQASAKLRAICIEGADSRDNLLDTVDWMAKNFFNTFYLQADSVYAFMERYSSHSGNPLLPPEPLSRETGAEVTAEVISALKKRGLALQQFGHGPTCEILGLSHWGWDPATQPVTPEMKKSFAMINGKRELWHNSPKYTQLCYSDPDIQEKLTDRVVQLITENPAAELVNFFLSDHHHNFCECDCCRQMRPSDWYVKILNKIDEKLTALHNNTRIGFAVYYDLLWPPVKERLHNPERFFLVACPVTRSYSEPLNGKGSAKNIPPYLQNISPYSSRGDEIMAFYSEWKKTFPGECVFFEYHYMWDLHKNYGAMALPEVLHADVTTLADAGMNGFISCQNLRAFYPNALGMQVMGSCLWDHHVTFEEISEDHFSFAYGKKNADDARKYFEQIEKLLPAKLLRGEGSKAEYLSAAEKLSGSQAAELVSSMSSAIESGLNLPDPAQRESWEILKLHTEHFLLACRTFSILWTQGITAAEPAVTDLLNWARKNELRLQKVFDVYEYISVTITVTGVDRNRFMNSMAKEKEADLAEI